MSSSNISRCLTRGAPTFDIFVAGVIALILAPTNIVAVALVFVFVLVWWLAGVGERASLRDGQAQLELPVPSAQRLPPPLALRHHVVRRHCARILRAHLGRAAQLMAGLRCSPGALSLSGS